MTRLARWPRWVLPAVLLAATGLFVLGVALEPDEDTHHGEAAERVEGEHAGADEAAETAEREEGEHAAAETGETGERAETAEGADAEAAEAAERDGGESEEAGEERVLGLDTESPLLVTVAVLVSVALAALAWSRPDRRTLVVTAVVAAGFTVLDVAEVVHQLDEDRPGLALLAAGVAILHALVAAVAASRAATAATDAAATPA